MENSFLYEFESWVPSWCVSADAHTRSHFNNYKNCMDVLLPDVGFKFFKITLDLRLAHMFGWI